MIKSLIFCLFFGGVSLFSLSAYARCMGGHEEQNYQNADAIVKVKILSMQPDFTPKNPAGREDYKFISWKSDPEENKFDSIKIEIREIYKNSSMLQNKQKVLDAFIYHESVKPVIGQEDILVLNWSPEDKMFQVRSGECALELDFKKHGIKIDETPKN